MEEKITLEQEQPIMSNPSITVGQRLTKILIKVLLILLEIYGIVALIGLYIFAAFIKSLRNGTNRAIGKLTELISNQYQDIMQMLEYDGEVTGWKITSVAGRMLIYLFTIYFLWGFSWCIAILLIYAIFIKGLRDSTINSISILYNGCGRLGNKMNNCLSFDENTNLAWKIPSIIIQIINHSVAALILFSESMYIACIFIFWIWFTWLRSASCHAISRTFKRCCKHIKAIFILCLGKQPDDIEIEEDMEGEGETIIHYKKDGSRDLRYRENFEFREE